MLEAIEQQPATSILSFIVLATALIFVGRWVGAVNSDRTSFHTFTGEVRDDIKEILSRLSSPPPVSRQSPVQLTEFGKTISETVSATEWARKAATHLVETVRDKEEFEIYEACIDHVSESFEHDSEFSRAVKAGAYQIGTDSSDVLQVYHVELRDQILALMSGKRSSDGDD